MLRKRSPLTGLIFILLTSAIFSLPGVSFASQISDISAALDKASSRDDIIRQAAQLETLVKSSPSQKVYQQLGRALYLLGEGEGNKNRKLDYLKKSLDASGEALRENPADAVSLYWKAMALLQEADVVGGLKALSDVKQALRGLETVSAREPGYDYAGAYRSRGKVLIDAPGWSFIGDKKKGLELLLKAKEIAPENLVNRLYLAQAYLKNGMKDKARAELGFIVAAPARKGDKDAADTKADAAKLLKEAR
jgi:tetratricopeptide (TPR) repeat protein